MNPRIALLFGIICISLSPILVKGMDVHGLTSAFYRIFITWALLVPFLVLTGKLQKISRKNVLISMLTGLIFASDIAVWNISIRLSSATVATLLANMAPVWVGIGSMVFLKARPGWLFWLGTGLAFSGMMLLAGPELLQLNFDLGFLLAVLSSMFYACYILLTKDVLRRINMLTFMFWNMLAASIFLLLICLINNEPLTGFSTESWIGLASLGIISQLAGWLTINYAIQHLPSTSVSVSLLSQAFVTGLFAWVFLDEILTGLTLIGGCIVLAGIAVTYYKPKSQKRKEVLEKMEEAGKL